ncbi:nascent polypeptide-associated complex subunit alpha, muscle-specific form-like [Penaeus indicus]|uniref:nascent polypeptide-associated complex subunit alpha, muscle-specific form-like n=1 Tax=Penaeus indicus TaxID=29960 RepID=UPI00300CA94C
MSVICQTFVQNAWRKDLCSNCFKSKDEHGGGGGGGGDGGGGGRGGGGGGGGRGPKGVEGLADDRLGEDEGVGLSSRGSRGGGDEGGVGGSRRYVGVAGSVYQRSYYSRNSWNSMVIAKSASNLKSPRLIKDMSSLVSRENEKNLLLSGAEGRAAPAADAALRSSRLVQQVRSQSEARLLSELLGQGRAPEPKGGAADDKGDASSDLGSDASHDGSSSAPSSSASSEASASLANSDTASLRSEAESHHSDLEKEETTHADDEEEEEEEGPREAEAEAEGEEPEEERAPPPVGILKKSSAPRERGPGRGAIAFRATLEEVIGYGGDVDYSDDEDDLMDDDDDDDDDEDDFAQLSPDERVLRRLTEKNTDFNSDNDNLKKDIEELLPSVKELEEKRKMILAEIEELERLGRENRSRSEGAKLEADLKSGAAKDEQPRPEGGKVKLKRSPPLVTVKPLIARNNADLRVNQVLPMKNGEVVRPALAPAGEGVADDEDVPLKGIKPKYVPREEEMVEKTVIQEEEEEELQKTSKSTKGKVTSIDDLLAAPAAPAAAPTKVTNIDSILAGGTDAADAESNAQKAKEVDPPSPAIETPPASSVAPSDSRLSANAEPKQQVEDPSPAGVCEAKEAKEPLKAPPTSAPRTSLAKPLSPGEATSTTEEPRRAPEASPRESPRQVSPRESPRQVSPRESPRQTSPKESPRQPPPEKPKSPPRPSPPETRPLAARKTSLDTPRAAEASRTSPDAAHKLSAGTRRRSVEASPEAQLKEAVNSKVQTPRLEAPLAEAEAPPAAESIPVASETPRRPSVAKTPSPELAKTPASRQSSNSSLLTTFGTPIVVASSPQNSSFLHAASTRSMYEAPYAPPSPAYTPATPDFLRDIKAPQEAAAPTAGIQKSALYASTSCLKGLPGAKPVITPKPPILKDKPKVSYRSSGSSSPRVYATPAPIAPRHSVGSISGAVSTPNLASLAVEDRSDAMSTSSGMSEASSAGSRPDAAAPKRPPPTTQAPAVPAQQGRPPRVAEAVYDVPVAVHAGAAGLARPARDPRDDETIYHEIDDSLQAAGGARDAPPGPPAASSASSSPSGSSVDRHESTRCQSRSTFEANRSLLSAALDFGTKATRSSSSKRPAPRPPAEGEAGGAEEEEEAGREEEKEDERQRHEGKEEEEQRESHGYGHALQVPSDNRDGESYSSFTDDFDDDDDDDEEPPPLRKAERSSSAVPFYRNSIGPVGASGAEGAEVAAWAGAAVATAPNPEAAACGTASRPAASRSHSVPRASAHAVSLDASVAAATAAVLVPQSSASTASSSSRFSFGRSGFFRPSSPPTAKRGGEGEARGRDRTKKGGDAGAGGGGGGRGSSSRFSLKKLLRLGSSSSSSSSTSKEEEKRKAAAAAAREQERRELLREARKSRLQIIHPLDYHQDGVQVIARPEKTTPIYDYTGIYGYVPPPQGMQPKGAAGKGSAQEELYASPAALLQAPPEPPPLPSGGVEIYASVPCAPPAGAALEKKSSFLRRAPPEPPPLPSGGVEIYASVPCAPPAGAALEKKSSFLRREPALERRESFASESSPAGAAPPGHLGFNSEGRPKPPPPPRKVSLESSQGAEATPPFADDAPAHAHLRPQRPPPPTRTPSSAGDVRAPITPRKPGRTSSIRGEEDREKRRAPQPPAGAQDAPLRGQIRHQHEDSTSSTGSGSSAGVGAASARASKGPAPARPHQPHVSPAAALRWGRMLGVDVCVREDVFVCVREGVFDCVREGIFVCVREGVFDCVQEGIFVCVREDVFVCVREGVFDCVREGTFVCVREDVFVCVREGVFDCVREGTFVCVREDSINL